MTKNMNKLINNIKSTWTIASERGYYIDVNDVADYIHVNLGDEEYFFQGDEVTVLKGEYDNDCTKEYVSFEEYLMYMSQSW